MMHKLVVDLSDPCSTMNATCRSPDYWGWMGNRNDPMTINGEMIYWESDPKIGHISRQDADEITKHLIAIREIFEKRNVNGYGKKKGM